MDNHSGYNSQELHQSAAIDHIHGGLAMAQPDLPAACVLCQRIVSPDHGAGDFESISMCGDCKFLFLEEFGTPAEQTHGRTTRARRTRQRSSESIENLFSQQFSHMISMARHSQPTIPDHGSQTMAGDEAARFMQRRHSRTTPRGSRRWRTMLSDTESDGFESPYGESESNFSFSGYRLFPSESDAISFSAYGGDSDASVDGHSLWGSEMVAHPDAGSNLDSDTDIDPMHAGLSQWNSDDQEEEEDSEWEEADVEENAAEHSEVGSQLGESINPLHWDGQHQSPETQQAIHLRTRGRGQTNVPTIFANLEVSDVLPFVWNSRNYPDERAFDYLLDRLAETDSSRRGAPPAAASYVNTLPHVVISKEHEKHDGLACAICKEGLSVGTVVNQLPCFHFYHPSCILPWLSSRNSCPLCRYELPTDDKDYEEEKQDIRRSWEIHESQQQQQGIIVDSSSDASDDGEVEEAREFGLARVECVTIVNEDNVTSSSGRDGARRWFFLAAAPVVGIVGVVLVIWLGNPLIRRRGPNSCHFPGQGVDQNLISGSWPLNQRESRGRRWWSLF